MADIRSNFIAGKMNKSVDERLVPLGEYIDALNVRLGSTESTEIGAVENSKGNSQLTFLQYAGSALSNPPFPAPRTTFCLGVYEDGMNETLYWFVHDSNNAASPTGKVDMIVSFNTNSNTVTYHVVCVDDGGGVNTTLNFDPKYLVTGVSKIEDLLFFTDDLNPPRVININRNYEDVGAFVPGVDGVEEEDIGVIVKPPGFETPVGGNIPLPVPTVVLENFPGDENYMETRFLCFAYRYRYEDGGYSATSLFSKPAFQASAFRFNLDNFNNAGMVNRYNGATISFSTGSKRVTQVDLLYKESNSNVIYVIERYNKADLGWANDITQSLTFSNSKIYTTLGSDELLRMYDNVPRTAKAQTIQGNRLMYGNYVDGYDIVDQNDKKIPIAYVTELVQDEIGGVALDPPVATTGIPYSVGQPGGNTVVNSLITFNLSALTLPIQPGLTINFDVSMQSAPSTGGMGNPQTDGGPDTDSGFQQTSPFSLTWSFTAPTVYPTISDMVNSTEFQSMIGTTALGNYQPLIPLNLSGQGGTLTDKFNNYCIAPPSTAMDIINSSITSGCATAAPPASAICTQQGFRYTPTATGFQLQAPSMRYYSEDIPAAGDVSNQWEFFSFIDFSSTAGYLLSADTYSLHSNRDYETGIVYMDDYGRASTVLVANNNTIFVPPRNSRDKNTIKVTLTNIPPYWATKYKWVVKPSEGEYLTLYSALYYEDAADASVFWFKLEGDNTNIAEIGMDLIVKADTLGPLNSEVICKILDIQAYKKNADELAGDNLAGLYMSIKPGGFNTELADNAIINYGNKSSSSNSTSCGLSNSYSLNDTDTTGNAGTPYDLPAGSSIRVKIDNWRGSKGSNCTSKHYRFDDSFTASQDYPDFYYWWYGDSRDFTTGSSNGVSCQQYLNNGSGPYGGSNSIGSSCFNTKLFCYTNGTSLIFRNRCGIPRCTSFWGDKRPGHVGTRIEVTRGGQLIVWETTPAEVDPNLFYDASQMYNIYQDPMDSQWYHESGIAPGDQNQDAVLPLVATLNFANCFTFGNGVESFRINDSPAGKTFQLGERVLAVSNQDYKEADRFAGMTYSGVYSGAANSNNLNEFNLGLANYKDCEPSFGPIQILYSRETDILCLQEDRISYVLASKNVITDSTGGGAIASVPQVLGTQIARIEEYGISFNPESFSAWGSDMFFTDAKRSSVINLRGTSRNNDQIQVISSYGMRSWFRDQFAAQLHTQKLGGFDPYMNEFVLSTNERDIPFPIVGTPCGTNLTQTDADAPLSYTVNLGEAIGTINIPYTITSGTITVDATWGGTTFTTGVVGTSGTLSFQKTSQTPNTVDIVVTPATTATYGITVDCPPTVDLTVIRIVLSSPSTDGQFIHFKYNWEDGSNIAPSVIDLASMGLITPTEYISQTGQASIGVYPYSGSTINMSTVLQGFDDFVFDPAQDKFKWLSSNTLYPATTIGMQNLLSDPNIANMTPILNPAPGTYTSSVLTTGATMPPGNTYLYLVWDLRETTGSELCYSATSAEDACCGCIPTCTASCWFGPMRSSEVTVCATDTNSSGAAQYSFHGTGAIPQVGEVCFENTNCNVSAYLPAGFYIVDPNQPSAASPKNWIQIGVNGAVIAAGNC